VTTAAQRDMTAKELPEIHLENIIGEPTARNTAAAIGYAAVRITHHDPQAGFLVLPSDHLIENKDSFVKTMTAGAQVAAKTNAIVTFGIKPSGPSTAYGYVKKGAEHADIGGVKVFDATGFKEKPDSATAKKYVDSGEYSWNSGMFIFKNTSLLAAMEKHLPKHHAALTTIAGHFYARDEETVTVKEYWALEPVSIDYGILEKAENLKMVEADFDWKDVGSWSSLEQVLGKDGDNNAAKTASSRPWAWKASSSFTRPKQPSCAGRKTPRR
jgi:mannose-1-phosphate guanylyltransferase